MKTKQIDQLRRARTGLRGWMTRDFDAVTNIIESHSPEVERVEEKLGSIVTRLQKAEDLQMEIEKLLNNDDEVQAEVDAQGYWFDMVRERIHRVKSWLKDRQKQDSSEKAEKVESVTSVAKNTSCTPKMKLPKTDLRKFSGDVLDWPEFWDIFRVAVHDNIDIPPVQKFVYLKSLLTGEAAGYVANFKTEEANYELAVERLQSRYGKDDVQRNRLMTKLADMKPIDQSNKAMRDTVDELCATVRALQVQGVTPDQYGALLMPLIESKLPKDWRLEWARQKTTVGKATVTFSKLLEFLEQELEIRESADQSDEKSQTSKNKSTERGKSPLPTASGLMAKSGPAPSARVHTVLKSAPYRCQLRIASTRSEKPRLAFVVLELVTEWSHANIENHANVGEDPTSYSCVRQVERKILMLVTLCRGTPLTTQAGTLLPIHFYLARVKLRRHPNLNKQLLRRLQRMRT